MADNNIIFIGMPAVGKSTVGVVVAKRLGYEFIDTDLLIQKQENRLLREIIAEEGLDGFLSIENQVNRDVEVSLKCCRTRDFYFQLLVDRGFCDSIFTDKIDIKEAEILTICTEVCCFRSEFYRSFSSG